jgi:hypothetical protein
VPLRLSLLALTNAVAFVRLLPMNDVDKDVEILVLRHQLAVLQRQIDEPHLAPPDRALSRPTCTDLPRPTLRRLHLIVSPTQSCAGTATSSATGTARRPARDGLHRVQGGRGHLPAHPAPALRHGPARPETSEPDSIRGCVILYFCRPAAKGHPLLRAFADGPSRTPAGNPRALGSPWQRATIRHGPYGLIALPISTTLQGRIRQLR